ncbi:MAG TPA: gephyrin-like molybdotransferase Glp [Acidobacteriota bacterium]|jgi:molybdenum cofactor synthesis domain-containing protein
MLNVLTMISVSQALEIIRVHTPAPQPDEVSLEDACGRTLCKDIYTDTPIPPFHRATMDGFAFRAADVSLPGTRLRVVGESAAGHGFPGTVGRGEAVRIMTGAAVPSGADCVAMVEKTSSEGEIVVIQEAGHGGKNIAPAGSEVGMSDFIPAGRRIGAADLAVLAAFGATRVPVYRDPEVAVLVTGDELIEPGCKPAGTQIRNSNAYSLRAQVRSCGIEPHYLGVAPDKEEILQSKIEASLAHDVAVFSGGVSVGQYDLISTCLERLKARIHFNKVSLKPGKPLTFATLHGKLLFGLPGNPVSCFVTFEIFVRPVIAALQGRQYAPQRILATAQNSFTNKGPRPYYAPALTRCTDGGWETKILAIRGSADIFRFSEADSLVLLPPDTELTAGDRVSVLLLNDYLERTGRQ